MSKFYYSLGLMSGTSADGVDASIIQSNGDNEYKLILDRYFKYDQNIYENIHNLKEEINDTKDLKHLSERGKVTLVATKAYILIETAEGKTKDVTSALNSLDDIVNVDAVTGPYDIIAIVNSTDLTTVGDLVTSDIHTITGIVRTVTCLSLVE